MYSESAARECLENASFEGYASMVLAASAVDATSFGDAASSGDFES